MLVESLHLTKTNRYNIYKCYSKMNDVRKANEFKEKALEIPAANEEEKQIDRELRQRNFAISKPTAQNFMRNQNNDSSSKEKD